MEFYNKRFIVLVLFVFFSWTLEIDRFRGDLVHTEETAVTMIDPILVTRTTNPTRLSHSTQSLTVIEREQ